MERGLLALILSMLALFGGVLLSIQDNDSEYQLWKAQHSKSFSGAEDFYRRMVFYKNLDEINTHNSNPDRTYDMGVNQFTGFTQEEFASLYLNPKPYNPEWENVDTEYKLGADIDWTQKGMVSPVKDQGRCGSCWAFSAVGVLESFSLMKGKSVNLAEQQLVDCSKSFGNQGCNGGFNYQGLAYVKAKGITDTGSYPYVAKTQSCKVDGGSFKISSVPSAKGCTGILQALGGRPIGVSCDANKWSSYKSGIFNNCGKSLDHDILLVGATDSYYKIKNSWGKSWGENGFIRLAPGNTCGICQDKSPWVA